jgi:hypothetical protein
MTRRDIARIRSQGLGIGQCVLEGPALTKKEGGVFVGNSGRPPSHAEAATKLPRTITKGQR